MEDVIVQIASAVNMRTLYPAQHPHVMLAVDRAVASLASQLAERDADSVTILIVGDDLVLEQVVLRRTNLAQRSFVEILRRAGIERVTLGAGMTAEEAHAFVSALAAGQAPQSSPHIVLGHVHVGLDEASAKDEVRESSLTLDRLEAVRDAFKRFRSDQQLPIGAIEQIVWGFIDSISRDTRDVLPLARLKEHDEYTFVHSVNVSLLVLAQARSFGIRGAMLHAVGMAALMHDIGKLMVPLDVLNRPGKLEGEDWELMKSHTTQGAWYLSETEGVAPLAVSVAYEHHLRFDGHPAYPAVTEARIPNLATRMTSIADAYDAMVTIRPYQKSQMREGALEILKNRAGTFYDPLLVANFVRIAG
jgi:HD-GYP domain-containing protein (c-di-GMP phosphodiesterase class II)